MRDSRIPTLKNTARTVPDGLPDTAHGKKLLRIFTGALGDLLNPS
jgi:hypothetical protein